jgi:effector-binding domain-containing protein
VVYWDHAAEKSLIESKEGVEIDVGWEVDAPYSDPRRGITTVRTPNGATATTTHVGPYSTLGEAHRAVRDWILEHGLERAGPSWEVYDHPREGEPPRADVFYLIR